MKNKQIFLLLLGTGLLLFACNQAPDGAGKDAKKTEEKSETVIRKKYKGEMVISESSYKGNVKHGLTRTYYYPDGELNKEIWYENGLKEDTARWHYKSGAVYRATPYVHDQIQGIQQKFYESGRLMARIPYDQGERIPGLQEFNEGGSLRDKYPHIEYHFTEIPQRQMYLLEVKLSSYDNQAEFYLGRLQEGRFSKEACQKISINQGKRTIALKTTSGEGLKTVDVIALYDTRLHNKKILVKQIPLPKHNLVLFHD